MSRILCALMGVVGKSEIRNLQLIMLLWRVLLVIPTEGAKRANGGICGFWGKIGLSLHSTDLSTRARWALGRDDIYVVIEGPRPGQGRYILYPESGTSLKGARDA